MSLVNAIEVSGKPEKLAGGEQPAYKTISVEPLTSAAGARVRGVDLTAPLSNKAREEIVDAFYKYSVLSFPDQDLSPAQQVEVAGIFGTPEAPRKFRLYDESDPMVALIEHDGTEEAIVGEVWHADNMDYENPYAALVMYCEVSPPVGGDTMFSSMYAAYEALSEPMKAFLEDMTALNDNSRAAKTGTINPNYQQKGMAVPASMEHPVIRTHPVTKRKLLYVNQAFSKRIVQLPQAESEMVLNYLFNLVATRPDFQCRHKWAAGTLVVWDNTSLQHYAVGGYKGLRRMRRVEVGGDKPY